MALRLNLAAAICIGALAATANTGIANAFWKASGAGTGSVPTKAGAARLITLSLSSGGGHKVTASGNAGTSTAYGTTVTVVLCKQNTWPCPTGQLVATLTPIAAAGTYSVTPSTNFNGVTMYGRASQPQTSGWTDYSAVTAAFTA